MKTFATIVSFIVLFLSTVPCSAFANHSVCNIEKNCEDNSHDCGNDCNGKCSPFYSCGTCVGFTINLTSAHFSKNLDFATDDIEQPRSYDKFINSSFICKIWQPPKIS
ncbi:hypothetical protein CLU83_0822 [Flavobacterium sp. 1]|nr:hypothetical protein CLU83_0822 [Flavobacterium sp. 1]